jgi:hypothetical protein
VRAAAVNAVFVPRPGVHEGLDEQAEGVRLVQLEFLEQRAAALDGPPPHRAQIGSAQRALTGFLRAVELQVELEFSVTKRLSELVEKGVVGREADAVGIQQHVVDAGVRVQPREQLGELRMQRRLAARERENLDAALAVDHALDARLQLRQRHRIHLRAPRRIRKPRRAREVARVHDLDQREAGGKSLERRSTGTEGSAGFQPALPAALRPSVPRTAPSLAEQALPPQHAFCGSPCASQ